MTPCLLVVGENTNRGYGFTSAHLLIRTLLTAFFFWPTLP